MVVVANTDASENAARDDDSESSATRSQSLRRKRQRTESNTSKDNDCDKSDVTPSGDVNEYNGWQVPEANYQIPVLGDQHDLNPKNFYEKYIRRRRPVVIRKSKLPVEVKHLQHWMTSNEDMVNKAGDEKIMVEKRNGQKDSFGKGNEVPMEFAEFLKLIIDKNDSLHYLTTQDVEANRDGRPELMSPFMKKLHVNGTFPLRPTLTGNLVPQNINLWMGNSPDGASSGLHHDYHDNLYIVLRGTKRFRLYSPADTGKMYTRGTLLKVHSNGRINYKGEETTAYGADPGSYAAAQAQAQKEQAEERLVAAEKAVAEGKPGAQEELEKAETMLDEAMEAILDAENDEDDDDDEDAFCLETAKEEDVEGLVLEDLSEDDDEEEENMEDDENVRIVDKTVKNPNNFSKVDPEILDAPKKLQTQFPNICKAKAAFCECSAGDILYLPASWFHEVQSRSAGKGHMALNYWFHPPDAQNNFEHPYSTDFWPNDFKDRFKDKT